MSKTENPRIYQPRKRRMLDDHGNFTAFSEDLEASEKVYKNAGMTREEMEDERSEKRLMNRNLSTPLGIKGAIGSLSSEALQRELDKRAGKTPVKKVVKTDDEKGYNTQMPKPTAVAGLKDEQVEKPVSDFADLTVMELKAKLDDMGVPYSPSARKSKLVALLENDGMPTSAGKED